MLEARYVPAAVVLILLAALAPAAGAGRVRFVSPDPAKIVMGQTTVAFEVAAGDPLVERVDVYANGRFIGSTEAPDWTLPWYADPSETVAEIVGVAMAGGVKFEVVRIEPKQAAAGHRVDVDLVQVYPVVTGPEGYVSGLGRDDFLVEDDGVVVPIAHFNFEPTDLSLFLLLDGSQSMTPYLENVQVAACRFVDGLEPTDELAVYSFNQTVHRAASLTSDHRAAKDAILDLDSTGSTALYDAIVRVVDEMRAVPGRKALFVFSDGRDRQSFASIDRVVEVAQRNDVLIYAVASGQDEESAPERIKLGRIAEDSGGRWFSVSNPLKIGEALGATLLDLQAQYRIGYYPPSGPSGVRTIRVRVPGHRRYAVRHRKNYYHDEE